MERIMTSLISLRNIKKEYQLGETTVQALRGVDLEIERGAYYSIIGPSGSGKSTLLHILGCMDVPTSGEANLNGQPLNGASEKALTKIRAKDIGFIFQAFHLNPILTVRENVAIALRFLGVPKAEAHRRAEACLQKVGMGHRLDHYPSELSGGERQRVAIARALVKKPSLILADEPTGNLDTKRGMEVIELIRQINREEGTTIIQVTHDPEVAAMSDVIIKMRDGQICEGKG
jgi:putative ABC transport system ATP-binding protein